MLYLSISSITHFPFPHSRPYLPYSYPLPKTPPPLGTPFPEDPEYRKKRLKFRFIKDAQVDLDTTYSFSVCTQNLDLLNWTIVGMCVYGVGCIAIVRTAHCANHILYVFSIGAI
ncbi:hypothetical protein EON65_18860 [archaeon]|nr:MAG: hypothetical protein EON65_18860 [archaeon]